MAQTTSLVFNGGVIPSPSPAPSGNGKAKLLKIGEITVTEQEVQVTKNVICDPDLVTTVAPFMEVLTSARLAELVQANNILVLDDGTMQYLMSDSTIAVEDGTAVCTAVNFLGLSKENRAKVLYPCTRLIDELTLQQVIEVGEPVETDFNHVLADGEDSIPKYLEDAIIADEDGLLRIRVTEEENSTPEHPNKILVIDDSELRDEIDNNAQRIENIEETIDELDYDSVPHAYLNSTLNHSAGDSVTTRTTIDVFAYSALVGDCFEFEQTTTIDDTPFGYIWVEPGTYLINGSVTLQWVGDPRGTFIAKVGSVMGENFDFSQEQEILRNHTKIVTIPNRMKLAINITYDAGTPVMGFWIQSMQVVKLAGGMSQTKIMHDSTLVGQGSISDPLGVTTNVFAMVKEIQTSVNQFRTGDVIPVDGPSGPAKMPKDALLMMLAAVERSGANFDFSITDAAYNAIAIFKNGHLRTKNFNSENTAETEFDSDTEHDFVIKDENGNAVLVIKNGQLRTKNFNSENINRVSPLKGKRICFIGDSITAGSGLPNQSYAYPSVMSNLTECISVNLGLSGDSIGGRAGSNYGHFKDRATAQNLTGADLVVVFGGTNDFDEGTFPIGALFKEVAITPHDYVGSIQYEAPDDTKAFGGALHELIKTIRTNAPAVPICFVTPLNRGPYASRRTPNSTQTNAHGETIDDFRSAIIEVCSFYGIPVFKANLIPQMDFTNTSIATKYSQDNLHPNVLGARVLAEYFVKWIENNLNIGE